MAKTEKNTTDNAAAEDKNTALAVAENKTLAMAADFMAEDDFGGGFEGIDKDSFQIPFIMLLQKMSPLVDEDSPKYVPGAKAGMFYNTVTGKLFKEMTIIPCAFKRSYVKWGGREGGDGGYKGEFTPEQIAEMVGAKEIIVIEGKLYAPDEDGVSVKNPKKNDYYADTRSHFVLAGGTTTDGEVIEPGIAIVPLASTQTKASKTMMTMLDQKRISHNGQKKRPPTYANTVKMSTVAMSNAQGQWSGFKFELVGLVDDAELYAEAKQFYLNVTGGKVKADFAKADNEASGDSDVSGEATTADQF